MVTCSLDTLKKPSKRKEMRIKTIYSRKETGKQKIKMMEFLALTLYLLVSITLTLISSLAIIADMPTLPILAGDSRFGSFNLSTARSLKSCKNSRFFRYAH